MRHRSSCRRRTKSTVDYDYDYDYDLRRKYTAKSFHFREKKFFHLLHIGSYWEFESLAIINII